MAAEDEFATHLEQVLPRLLAVGATGALLWCFADYDPVLYTRPPCDQAHHERFFGLIRPDGSLKPHASVVQRFAATHPAKAAPHPVALDVSPDVYYRAPLFHAQRLYQQFQGEIREAEQPICRDRTPAAPASRPVP